MLNNTRYQHFSFNNEEKHIFFTEYKIERWHVNNCSHLIMLLQLGNHRATGAGPETATVFNYAKIKSPGLHRPSIIMQTSALCRVPDEVRLYISLSLQYML